MKTFIQTKENAIKDRKWLLVDAANQTLGRISSKVATILRGKHKAEFTPNADCGDYVVVINASKVKLTGNKLVDKIYYKHTEYMGSMKSINAGDKLAKNPGSLITEAVQGMLPKGPLGRAMAKKLKVFAGAEHKHTAHNPKVISI